MYKAYKTEIKPTESQKRKINQCIGTCRYLYNEYIKTNQKKYQDFKEGKTDKSFISGIEFDKYINNEVKCLEEFSWINECGSKARKQAIMNGERAYKKFLKKEAGFPRLKKKGKSNVKLYFPKNSKGDWTVQRHRIQIPTLKFVRLKEYGYIPVGADIVSGTVSKKSDRYFVSVLVKEEDTIILKQNTNEGIGIDLGLKEFAVCSNGQIFKNINKLKRIIKLEKRLKREQRKLSRKYEVLKKKKKEGGTATYSNITKQKVRVQKLYIRLTNSRTDYVNKVISELIKQEPSFIVLEDLNIRGMMKNRHLSKAIASQKFYEFRKKLIKKCNRLKIEVRLVDRFYPSSKTCYSCGHIKEDLKLRDRIYKCEKCHYEADRDFNASLNLRDCKKYKVA